MIKSRFLKIINIKILDFAILLIFAAILAFSILSIQKKGHKEPVVIINSPDGEYIYPLNKDREIQIKGLIGISVIQIRNGSASFKDSPCPNKTCVGCTPVYANLEWTACLPNQIFIRIERNDSGTDSGTDISTY